MKQQRGQPLHGGGEVGGHLELRCEDQPRRRDLPLVGSEVLPPRMDHHPLSGTSRVRQVGGEGSCRKEQNNKTEASRK